MNKKVAHYFVVFAFTILYIITSFISTVHVVDFFALTNPVWLAISLAIAFEIGAAASLASIVALDKMNKWMVWLLFIVLTAMQGMGNTYYAYDHAHDFKSWIELFGLAEEDLIYQKRILGLISGAILPVVALLYIKALVDYIKPATDKLGITKKDKPELPQLEQEIIYETTSTTTSTTEQPIVIPEIEQITTTEEPIQVEPILTTEPEIIEEQTTEAPSINNTGETTLYEKTLDEKLSRGEKVNEIPESSLNLKLPHAP